MSDQVDHHPSKQHRGRPSNPCCGGLDEDEIKYRVQSHHHGIMVDLMAMEKMVSMVGCTMVMVIRVTHQITH